MLQQQILLMVSHFAPVTSLLGAASQKSAFSSSTEDGEWIFFFPLHSQHSVVCPGKGGLMGTHGNGTSPGVEEVSLVA